MLIVAELKRVKVDVWEKHPDKPGYLRRVEMRLLRDIHDECEKQMREQIPEDIDQLDYWSSDTYSREARWPENYAHVAVFARPGSNEGHYVHVGCWSRSPMGYGQPVWNHLMLLKTLQEGPSGMESALRLAAALTVMLSA